jgi:hypothetical protein
MQMRSRGPRIARITNSADDVAAAYPPPDRHQLLIEMRVVMPLAVTDSRDPDDVATEGIRAYSGDETVSGGGDRRASLREDIDAVMGAAATIAGGAEETLNACGARACNRERERRFRMKRQHHT